MLYYCTHVTGYRYIYVILYELQAKTSVNLLSGPSASISETKNGHERCVHYIYIYIYILCQPSQGSTRMYQGNNILHVVYRVYETTAVDDLQRRPFESCKLVLRMVHTTRNLGLWPTNYVDTNDKKPFRWNILSELPRHNLDVMLISKLKTSF